MRKRVSAFSGLALGSSSSSWYHLPYPSNTMDHHHHQALPLNMVASKAGLPQVWAAALSALLLVSRLALGPRSSLFIFINLSSSTSPASSTTLLILSLAAVGLASLVTAILVAIPRDAPIHGEGAHHGHHHPCHHHHCHGCCISFITIINFIFLYLYFITIIINPRVSKPFSQTHKFVFQLWKRSSSSTTVCSSGELFFWFGFIFIITTVKSNQI